MNRSPYFWLPLVMACSGAASTGASDSDCEDYTCIESPFEEAKSPLVRDTNPAVSDAAKQQLVRDNADFAVDLLTHVARPDQNQLHSPHSVSTSLSMLYAGARGSTRSEMAGALHFALPDDQLHAAFDWLDLEISGRGAVHVNNVLFGARALPLETPFLDTLAVSYGAGVQLVDFGDPTTKDDINAWIAARTGQRIPQALAALPATTQFALVNTIHLEAAWASPFAAFGDADFTSPSGPKRAPFINRTGVVNYRSDELGQVVELSLDHGLVFDIVLPAGDLATYEATLTGESLRARWPTAAQAVALRLPRFELPPSADASLVDLLKELGMRTAFDELQADLSAMSPLPGLYVEQVVHQTFLKVDEEGIEAAAATVVVGGDAGASAPPTAPAVMTVDKPFLLAIRDAATGAILFLGHVVDPTRP